MGVISRKIFPACGSMCVCCPALRSSSRKPVKRYKKLLAEIFPKSLDGPPIERKIGKLCEYAARNPVRIPKIAKYLEDRCYKELRIENIKFINIVTETYGKLLTLCKDHMAYFSVNLLNVVTELLENSKNDDVRVLGCQTLTRFIYTQTDATYTHNIESFVHKICELAREKGEESQRRCLRASSLQCLSAMIWYMSEVSHIFTKIEEIVHVTLDNFELDSQNDDDDERAELYHNWVDEVVRSEGRIGAMVSNEASPCNIVRPRAEKKDPSLLTREEMERPKVWAQICIQRMAELSQESTTMRRVLDPMFVYFDSGHRWVSPHGLAKVVLLDMSYFMESTGTQQLILTYLIRHLDHKNVSHDPELKSYIIQVATALARQTRSRTILAEIGFVSDLCRHLRKSLQATIQSAGEREASVNIMLQNSIEDCLLEIAKRIDNVQPLFDLMAITLEKLPSGTIARASIGSMIILAHTISLASVSSHSQQVFPESLLVQLLKVMVHPDIEVRVGAHQIFSILLVAGSNRSRNEVASLRAGFLYQSRRWQSNTASAFASITAKIEKLRREKESGKNDKHGSNVREESDEKENTGHKNSPNFYKISSIVVDRSNDGEPFVMRLSEDQIGHLMSALWIQASLPDNLPTNIEAISHSFILTLISSRLKNPSDNLMVVQFFQLLLSLRNVALDTSHGMLPPTCQRSVLVLSIGMLMFAGKIYQIPDLNDFLKSVIPHNVDPYLGISDDLQVYVRPEADLKEYGSSFDNHQATSILFELRSKIHESENVLIDMLVHNLTNITKLEEENVRKHLLGPFSPDDTFVFGPRSGLDLDHNQMVSHSKESLSFDGEYLPNASIEDDATSELSVADLSRFIPRVPASTAPGSHIISIGQLLESALEVAGHVAGSSVSTSPLPFSTIASQCEALGTGTRKKLSNWLAYENRFAKTPDNQFPSIPGDGQGILHKITSEDGAGPAQGGATVGQDPWLSMRLPPASPFDNFLKAAGC